MISKGIYFFVKARTKKEKLSKSLGKNRALSARKAMDFLIDGQISSYCPDQPEGKLLTLKMLLTQTHSIFVKL